MANVLTILDDYVMARCGSPTGGADCLVVHEVPGTVPPELRDNCSIASLGYQPDPVFVGGSSKLQRGTVVTVGVDCTEGLTVVAGDALTTLDGQIGDRCGASVLPDCIELEEKPVVAEGVPRADCTIVTISSSPEPVEVEHWGALLDLPTVVTAEIDCDARAPGG